MFSMLSNILSVLPKLKSILLPTSSVSYPQKVRLIQALALATGNKFFLLINMYLILKIYLFRGPMNNYRKISYHQD